MFLDWCILAPVFSEFVCKIQNTLEQAAASATAGGGGSATAVVATTTIAPTASATPTSRSVSSLQGVGPTLPGFFASPPPPFHHLSPGEFASTFFINPQGSSVGVVTTPPPSTGQQSSGYVITGISGMGGVPVSKGKPLLPPTQLAAMTRGTLSPKSKFGRFTSLENTLVSMATSRASLLSPTSQQATPIMATPCRVVDRTSFNPNSLLVNTAATNGGFSLFTPSSTSSPPFQPLPCYPVPTVTVPSPLQGGMGGGATLSRSLAPKVAAMLARAGEGNPPPTSNQLEDGTSPPKRPRLDNVPTN